MNELKVTTLYAGADEKQINSFSKKLESNMLVDLYYEKVETNFEWVPVFESAIKYLEKIFNNPNQFIFNEEGISKIEAIKTSRKVNKEESADDKFDTYENRFIFTLIHYIESFVSSKKITLLEGSFLKDNKNVEYKANSLVGDEQVEINLSIRTSLYKKKEESSKNGLTLLERIEAIEASIIGLKNCDVYRWLEDRNTTLLEMPIKNTDIMLNNENYQHALSLWNYIQLHYDDETKIDKRDESYEDDGKLKELFDDTFLLSYLSISSVDSENSKIRINKEKVIKQLVQKIVDLNVNLSEAELIALVSEQFAMLKYKNKESLDEISKLYRKHIDKYLNKIVSVNLNSDI